MTLTDALDGVRRICAAVPDVPVTADLESGYDTPAAELVERMLEAGAVGLNIEDTVHSEGRMRSVEEHADYIGAIRQACDDAGVDVVVNARTDVFLKADQFDDPVAEAITRLRACEDAGARCVYPVGVPDADTLRTLLAELSGPVNVIANPRTGSAVGSLDDLRALGVHRVTFGPKLMQELTPELVALVTAWR
jgi:2-methylisocitrate lyase-like PEP mutase family enzyme